MKSIVDKIIKNINANPFILIVNGFVFVLALLLGGFLGVNDSSISIFTDSVCNYYISVLALDSSLILFFIKRIINIALFFIPIALLCLNRYSFFITFVFVGYRGFILGISFKVILTAFSFNGFVIWLFLIFIQNIILTFAIVIFLSNVYSGVYCDCKFNSKKFIRYLIISLIIAVVGAILEFLLLICVFRPLNLYF